MFNNFLHCKDNKKDKNGYWNICMFYIYVLITILQQEYANKTFVIFGVVKSLSLFYNQSGNI